MDPLDEMLRGAQAGDAAAIEDLGCWLRQLLVRSFSRRFGPIDAEDLAHETIADVLAALDRAPGDANEFTRWVHGFGRNERREWIAADRRELDRAALRTDYAQVLPAPPRIDALFAAEEKRRLLTRLIDELPARQRLVYRARLEGYSYAEIAEAMKITVSTARSCARRARVRVAARWEIERRTPSPFKTPPKRNVS